MFSWLRTEIRIVVFGGNRRSRRLSLHMLLDRIEMKFLGCFSPLHLEHLVFTTAGSGSLLALHQPYMYETIVVPVYLTPALRPNASTAQGWRESVSSHPGARPAFVRWYVSSPCLRPAAPDTPYAAAHSARTGVVQQSFVTYSRVELQMQPGA